MKNSLPILILSGAAFFVLAGYEFFRSTSAALFQTKFGVQNLPLAMSLIPLVLIFAIYFYNQLLSRVKPRRTLLYTSIGSLLIILVSIIGIYKDNALCTWIYYIFREVYIVLIIEQYWSFVNSTLDVNSARKWTGILTGVGSLGAILGGILVHQFSIPLGTKTVSLIGVFFLLFSIVLADLSFKFSKEPLPTPAEEKTKEDRWMGAHLLFSSPLLTFLFLLVMTTQMMSTVLGLSFQSQLQMSFPNIDQQTAYSGSFYATLNGVALFLQFIGAPILLRFTTATFIQCIIPVVHVVTAIYLVSSPSLLSAATAFLLFKSFDYSLFRISKEMLYMPLSFDARYRAKELIDIFGYRFSKGATSLGVMALQKASFFTSMFYGGMSLIASCAWFLLIIPIARAATQKTRDLKTIVTPGALILISFFQISETFAFTLSPMTASLEPSGSGSTQSFQVANDSDASIAIELTISSRDLDIDGKESNPITEESKKNFLIYPTQLILNPKEKRTIRVSWRGEQNLTQELSFRLIAEQLPVDLQKNKSSQKPGASIKIMLKYMAALYVTPRQAKPKLKLIETHLIGKQIGLTFHNEGTSHQVLHLFKIKFPGEPETLSTFTLLEKDLPTLSGQNILAGKKRRFLIPIPRGLTVPKNAIFEMQDETR